MTSIGIGIHQFLFPIVLAVVDCQFIQVFPRIRYIPSLTQFQNFFLAVFSLSLYSLNFASKKNSTCFSHSHVSHILYHIYIYIRLLIPYSYWEIELSPYRMSYGVHLQRKQNFVIEIEEHSTDRLLSFLWL